MERQAAALHEAPMQILASISKQKLPLCLAALALLSVLFLAGPALTHSWYDPDCCSDRDCEPVSSVGFVASTPGAVPVMVVTTSFGTKPVTARTKVRESKDSRMHACIYQGELICLYMPPSN
jgi:hypothetical protein